MTHVSLYQFSTHPAGALKEARKEREDDKTTSIDHKIAKHMKSKEQRANARKQVCLAMTLQRIIATQFTSLKQV